MTDPASIRPPLRSALFVPAANARAVEKSAGIAADALIFDLEDSAAPNEKDAARERLAAHLANRAPGASRIVRINALDTPEAAADLAMAARAAIDAVLLPKVESAAQLSELDAALTRAGAPASLALWAMVETPKGILAAPQIAMAGLSRDVAALVVGPNDIVKASGLKLSPGRPELLPWLMQILLAGKAAGIDVLDGVYNDFRDGKGFAAECAQGRRLGFSGKTLIHPMQVEPANTAFAPDEAELEEARAIVAAFAEPANASRGVVQVDGRMVERLHLAQAEALLALASSISRRQS